MTRKAKAAAFKAKTCKSKAQTEAKAGILWPQAKAQGTDVRTETKRETDTQTDRRTDTQTVTDATERALHAGNNRWLG